MKFWGTYTCLIYTYRGKCNSILEYSDLVSNFSCNFFVQCQVNVGDLCCHVHLCYFCFRVFPLL